MKHLSRSENSRTISKELMRDYNTRAVISLLYNGDPIPRKTISQITGLTPATISNITSKLISSDLIVEVGVGQSTGGRKPTLLDINDDFGHVAAVKIEARRVISGLYDLSTNKIDGNTTEIDSEPDLDTVLEIIRQDLNSYSKTGEVLGVGIGVSGFISDSGTIIYTPILGWSDVPLADVLLTDSSIPVVVDNDVNAFTLAEGWLGAGKDYEDFLCVTVGEGVGAGLMIDGTLHRGAIGGAGEIGHITLDPNGPRCRCGENGCLEALASDYFLRNEIEKLDFKPPTIENLSSLASEGNGQALEIFQRLGCNLGLGIKNLVNTLNPEAVLLGGERLSEADFFMPRLKKEVLNHSFPEEARKLKIVRANLGQEGWLIGAALLAIRNFLNLPLHHKVRSVEKQEVKQLKN
ncbi:ROK family transcriptional regulator [Candidatus Bipolaricaulota bacterium]|nr:ROK family transcriptional regulator [Candidatus Bipolaricaulota bacterium]